MKKLTIAMVVVAACSASITSASTFSVVQAPNPSATSPGVISDLYALNGPGGQGFASADSFVLAPQVDTTFYITSISTYGFGFNGGDFSPASMSAIEVNIFGNTGALPHSTVLFNQTFNPATEIANTPNGSIAGFASYKTTFDFSATPIAMGAGGTFWLNVGGSGVGSATYVWNYATVLNDNAYRTAQSTMWGPWSNAPGAGLAYEINGYTEVVPEPTSMALILFAIPALKKRLAK